MLSAKWFHYTILFKRLLFILLTFQVSRIAFVLQNPETFTDHWIPVILAGLRYDNTVIFILNAPLILLHLIQGKYLNSTSFQKFISTLLLTINSIALLFNVIDTAWFSYIQKRSTADIFSFIAAGDDVSNNLLQYLLDYWYLLFFYILLVLSLVIFENKIRKGIKKMREKELVLFPIPIRILLFILFGSISLIGFRGGIQLKPLSIQTAAKLVPSPSIPLVLNTPYTIIKSWNDQLLEDPDPSEIENSARIFPIHFNSHPDSVFRPLNVVLIIMESFSYEHISYYTAEKNNTPFIDSLLHNSLSWPNTFANAKRSIEGIPAIAASIPAWMDQPFINSAYNVNAVNSLASLLRPYGYQSGFFHGGNNGTMGFDNFTRLAGYDKYFGKNEYDGPEHDDDGHWGIYDHLYFSFMLRQLNTWKEPFHATFFSLSSHHPYKIPPGFDKKTDLNQSAIARSMSYADAALASFFESAKNQSWYQNTLFIITADHSGPADQAYCSNRLGAYHIPLLFILPFENKHRIHTETAQQCDIVPSVLHLLNYKGRYNAFGRDLFETNKGWSINYSNNSWELITDEYILQYDGQESTHLFSREDTLLQNNLIRKKREEVIELEKFLTAALVQYRYSLIHNRLANP